MYLEISSAKWQPWILSRVKWVKLKNDALLSRPLIFSHAKSFENGVCIVSVILGFIAETNILMDGYEEIVKSINRPLYIYSYSVDNVTEVSETVISPRVWS